MRRFFVPPGSLPAGGSPGQKVSLGAELAHRLGHVLRLKPGDRVVLAGGGRDLEVELTAVSPRSVSAVVVAEVPCPPEPGIELVLYQSLIRAQRFELVLEKGTELGVSRFVPLVSERSQVRPERESGRAERWRRIVLEAAEQCGRGRVPEVGQPCSLEEALAGARGLRLLPWEGERAQGLRSLLRGLSEKPAAVSVFIGPEGGFSEGEVALARREGAATVSLGRRILRSETAGIVAAALVMHELGELGG